MNLIAFSQRFATESVCVDYLEYLRWGDRPVCPSCNCNHVYICESRRIYKCSGCKRQFSARTETIFGQSKLSLRIWFIAIYLMTKHKRGMSSLQLAERLDITQKSAWRLLDLVRKSINGVESDRLRQQPLKTVYDFDSIMKIIAYRH